MNTLSAHDSSVKFGIWTVVAKKANDMRKNRKESAQINQASDTSAISPQNTSVTNNRWGQVQKPNVKSKGFRLGLSAVLLFVGALFPVKGLIKASHSNEATIKQQYAHSVNVVHRSVNVENYAMNEYFGDSVPQEEQDFARYAGLNKLAEANPALAYLASMIDLASMSTIAYQDNDAEYHVDPARLDLHYKQSVVTDTPVVAEVNDDDGFVNPIPPGTEIPIIGINIGREQHERVIGYKSVVTDRDQQVYAEKIDKVWNILSQEDKDRLYTIAKEFEGSTALQQDYDKAFTMAAEVLKPYFRREEDLTQFIENVTKAEDHIKDYEASLVMYKMLIAGLLLSILVLNADTLAPLGKKGALAAAGLSKKALGGAKDLGTKGMAKINDVTALNSERSDKPASSLKGSEQPSVSVISADDIAVVDELDKSEQGKGSGLAPEPFKPNDDAYRYN